MNARITRNLAIGAVVTLTFLIGVLVPSTPSTAQGASPTPKPACPCGINSRTLECRCPLGCWLSGTCKTGEEGEATEPPPPTQVTYATLGPTQAAWHTEMAPTWDAGTQESLFATTLAEPETFEICYDCVPSDTCESGWRKQCEQHDPYLLGLSFSPATATPRKSARVAEETAAKNSRACPG